MNQSILAEVHKTGLKTVPEIKAGYTVRVHQKIKEGNKERIQIFEGLVIKVSSGTGLDKTFTVRKIASGVGVEKIFPLYSGNIAKIEVVKKAKVRRSKMYYMRERTGKAARLRETYLKEGDAKMLEHEEQAAAEAEAPQEAEEATPEEVPVEAEETTEEKQEAPAEEATPEAEADAPQEQEESTEEKPAEEPAEEAAPEAEEKPAEEEAAPEAEEEKKEE